MTKAKFFLYTTIFVLSAYSVPVYAGAILHHPGYTDQFVTVAPTGASNAFGDILEDGAGNIYGTHGFSTAGVFRVTGGVASPLTDVAGIELSLHLNGNQLFVGDSNGGIRSLDVTSPGAHTFHGSVSIGSAHGMIEAVAGFGAFGGQLIVGGRDGVVAFDPNTGTSTVLYASGGRYFSGLGFTPDGRLLATNYNSGQLMEILPGGGATVLASGLSNPNGLAIHQPTGEVFIANEGGNNLLRFDSTLTSQSVFASDILWDGGHFPSIISFTQDSSALLYGERDYNSTSGGINQITGFSVAAVPEPSTFAILGFGAFGFLGYRRRRNLVG